MKARFNYRHIICIIITLGFLACSVFVFPNALGRIIEAGRDFGLSVAYYFCELFGIEYSFTPTVNGLPKFPFFENYGGENSPTTTLPDTLTGFKNKWSEYWELWVSKENFTNYLGAVGNVLLIISKTLIIVLPFLLLLVVVFGFYLKRQNNDYDKDSKPLIAFKKVSYYTYRPIKNWILDFVEFIRECKYYWIIWVCLWAYNFNVFTILLEFFAFYLYFTMSFEVAEVYRQIYKLFIDLWTVFDFVPLWVWFIIGYYALNAFCIARAYKKLYHHERCNRGFLNERSINVTVYGYTGAGKTALITDMALSYEVQILSDALEVIIETDMHFPRFAWINLENELKKVLESRIVKDVWSCRKWIRQQCRQWEKEPCRDNLFNYDYELYGLSYDDNLKTVEIWQALEDYACAYLIYTVQSSYIVSNYSIRSDKLISDMGNFPLWDTDFFKRDSRLLKSFSRHSHILDFDMLRLGKKMLDNNPNRNAFGFGVYVITEIDKERKNQPELQGVTKNEKDKDGNIICNQKNDLFNANEKMKRHACVVANRVFVHCVNDLQRTGSLNSDMLELGDTIEVYDKGEMLPTLPFFSPFWLIDLFITFIFGKFENFYLQYRHNRSDNTLFMYLFKGLSAKLHNYRERIYNLFGSQTVELHLARGLQDGKVQKCKWYRQSKKIYSNRFSTDCLSGIYEVRGRLNTIGIDDLQEYADIMATNDELLKQHSHFQQELTVLQNTVK